MSLSMLEYAKMILTKVSFDTTLFEKEFKKAIIQLLPEEILELKNWLKQQFRGEPVLLVIGLSE
jgi:hypothetical protein